MTLGLVLNGVAGRAAMDMDVKHTTDWVMGDRPSQPKTNTSRTKHGVPSSVASTAATVAT